MGKFPGAVPAAAKAILKTPVYIYRYAVSPFIGPRCRHLPTCSAYAIDAIDLNGAWKGGWLSLSRLCRCHPWGTSGFDPAPDLRGVSHPFAPWLYGQWSWNSLEISGRENSGSS